MLVVRGLGRGQYVVAHTPAVQHQFVESQSGNEDASSLNRFVQSELRAKQNGSAVMRDRVLQSGLLLGVHGRTGLQQDYHPSHHKDVIHSTSVSQHRQSCFGVFENGISTV